MEAISYLDAINGRNRLHEQNRARNGQSLFLRGVLDGGGSLDICEIKGCYYEHAALGNKR